MVDAAAAANGRDELIAEINALLDELVALGVRLKKRERAELGKMTGPELMEELDCRRDQLQTRKKFFGGN